MEDEELQFCEILSSLYEDEFRRFKYRGDTSKKYHVIHQHGKIIIFIKHGYTHDSGEIKSITYTGIDGYSNSDDLLKDYAEYIDEGNEPFIIPYTKFHISNEVPF